jgi:hypothetical protein
LTPQKLLFQDASTLNIHQPDERMPTRFDNALRLLFQVMELPADYQQTDHTA